jgi:hypothetical protein
MKLYPFWLHSIRNEDGDQVCAPYYRFEPKVLQVFSLGLEFLNELPLTAPGDINVRAWHDRRASEIVLGDPVEIVHPKRGKGLEFRGDFGACEPGHRLDVRSTNRNMNYILASATWEGILYYDSELRGAQ